MIPHNYEHNISLHCINEAAVEYHIPARLILAILQIERGKVGQINRNKNGSYDIGPAQINSSWLPILQANGITQEQVQFDPCINIKVAAWIAAKNMADANDLLTGIGNYHSHSKKYNQSYAQKVRIHFTKIYTLLD